MRPIRVLHLLSRFNFGGIERQLIERLRRHPPLADAHEALYRRALGLAASDRRTNVAAPRAASLADS